MERVGAETRAKLAHQDLPFEIVVEELRPVRNPAHSPVFQVMFMYWDTDDGSLWDLAGCTVTTEPGDSATAKFDLTLSLTRSADRILRLSPDNGDALRDRGLAYLKLGYQQGARADMARYLQLNPDAQDSGPLRERLVELSSCTSKPS